MYTVLGTCVLIPGLRDTCTCFGCMCTCVQLFGYMCTYFSAHVYLFLSKRAPILDKCMFILGIGAIIFGTSVLIFGYKCTYIWVHVYLYLGTCVLTIGAASTNMTPQVEARFPEASDTTPAKIPPAEQKQQQLVMSPSNQNVSIVSEAT